MSTLPERLARCCPEHPDWLTLASHLVSTFATLAAGTVLDELSRARQAVGRFGLPANEALMTAELIARNQLMMLTGDVPDAARLDPERHRGPGSVVGV